MTTMTSRRFPAAAAAMLTRARRLLAAAARPFDRGAPAPLADGRIDYVVRAGDTAESVAAAHDVSTASLLVRNGLRLRTELEPGLRLVIDAACRGAVGSDADEIPHHDVRPGESLDAIALHHRVSSRVLMAANGLARPTSIAPGMTLAIPRSIDPRDTGEIPVIPLAHGDRRGVSSAA